MWEYMKDTGRHSPKNDVSSKAVKAAGPEGFGRQERVRELRKLVASGRYHVDSQRLAAKILIRALGRE